MQATTRAMPSSGNVTMRIALIPRFHGKVKMLAQVQAGRRELREGDSFRLLKKDQAMANYTAEVIWVRGDQDFPSNRYSRRHLLRFDGGVEVPGSSSPHVVPTPMSDPAAVDPEEAFVASIASCHMLWFLSLAAKKKFCVERYRDSAVGVMGRNAAGRQYVAVVTLRPEVVFSGERAASREELDALHRLAHEECFIANSVRTEIRCEPVLVGP